MQHAGKVKRGPGNVLKKQADTKVAYVILVSNTYLTMP